MDAKSWPQSPVIRRERQHRVLPETTPRTPSFPSQCWTGVCRIFTSFAPQARTRSSNSRSFPADGDVDEPKSWFCAETAQAANRHLARACLLEFTRREVYRRQSHRCRAQRQAGINSGSSLPSAFCSPAPRASTIRRSSTAAGTAAVPRGGLPAMVLPRWESLERFDAGVFDVARLKIRPLRGRTDIDGHGVLACSLCERATTGGESVLSLACAHTFCPGCFETALRQRWLALAAKEVPESEKERIPCPCCGISLMKCDVHTLSNIEIEILCRRWRERCENPQNLADGDFLPDSDTSAEFGVRVLVAPEGNEHTENAYFTDSPQVTGSSVDSSLGDDRRRFACLTGCESGKDSDFVEMDDSDLHETPSTQADSPGLIEEKGDHHLVQGGIGIPAPHQVDGSDVSVSTQSSPPLSPFPVQRMIASGFTTTPELPSTADITAPAASSSADLESDCSVKCPVQRAGSLTFSPGVPVPGRPLKSVAVYPVRASSASPHPQVATSIVRFPSFGSAVGVIRPCASPRTVTPVSVTASYYASRTATAQVPLAVQAPTHVAVPQEPATMTVHAFTPVRVTANRVAPKLARPAGHPGSPRIMPETAVGSSASPVGIILPAPHLDCLPSTLATQPTYSAQPLWGVPRQHHPPPQSNFGGSASIVQTSLSQTASSAPRRAGSAIVGNTAHL